MNNTAELNNHFENTQRKLVTGDSPTVLSDIYNDNVNIAVWQNKLTNSLVKSVTQLFEEAPNFQAVMITSPDTVIERLKNDYPELSSKHELCEYSGLLVDMFATLFEQKRVGLRLTVLSKAMCPKFHVDMVPCRLVTTLDGPATEWIKHENVDRSKLGTGSKDLSDELSGLYSTPNDIEQLMAGDVALLKGGGWFNNENAGLVHRSPALSNNDKRLILTLDFTH